MTIMPARCAGCAFTEGTEANRDTLTRLTKELCLMGGAIFYCHANAVNDVIPKDAKRMCHGFADAILTQKILGTDPPDWKRAVAREGLLVMEEAEARAARGEPEPADVGEQLVARVIARLEGR